MLPDADRFDTVERSIALAQVLGALENHRIHPTSLTRIDDIGAGGYAQVYRATWSRGGMMDTDQRGRSMLDVAVKEILPKQHKSTRLALRFGRELRLWSTLDHPHILKFLGFHVDLDQRTLYFVAPYLAGGSVRQRLNTSAVSTVERIQWVINMTDGLHYLHRMNPPIVHGDLKADNLLVSDFGAVLCDFGLSAVMEDSLSTGLTTSEGFKGSTRWCSPELFHNESRTTASDVWAWSLTTLEIMTGRIPFESQKNDVAVMMRVVNSKILPSCDEYPELPQHHRLWSPIHACLKIEPSNRLGIQACWRCISTISREDSVAIGTSRPQLEVPPAGTPIPLSAQTPGLSSAVVDAFHPYTALRSPRYPPALHLGSTSPHGNATHSCLRLRDAHDAHVLFQAVRQGHLPLIRKHLTLPERQALHAGQVFVWAEGGGSLKRWTDSFNWCPSRVRGPFRMYDEMPEDTDAFLRRKQHEKTGERRVKQPRKKRLLPLPGGLSKQTYSATLIQNGIDIQKWHLTAYFKDDGSSDLITVEEDPLLRTIIVPENTFESPMSRKSKGSSSRRRDSVSEARSFDDADAESDGSSDDLRDDPIDDYIPTRSSTLPSPPLGPYSGPGYDMNGGMGLPRELSTYRQNTTYGSSNGDNGNGSGGGNGSRGSAATAHGTDINSRFQFNQAFANKSFGQGRPMHLEGIHTTFESPYLKFWSMSRQTNLPVVPRSASLSGLPSTNWPARAPQLAAPAKHEHVNSPLSSDSPIVPFMSMPYQS